MYHPVVYLTDCTDTNAVARLSTRVAALFGDPAHILPLDGPRPDLMAGLTLVDIISSIHLTGEQQPTCTVLINIAPRDDGYANGIPFCYFEAEGSLIVTTANPEVLSFGRRYLGISEVYETDVQEVMKAAASWSPLSDSLPSCQICVRSPRPGRPSLSRPAAMQRGGSGFSMGRCRRRGSPGDLTCWRPRSRSVDVNACCWPPRRLRIGNADSRLVRGLGAMS